MFTLLRKVRHSLIKAGSTQRYLLYAFGEIILVVLGILIALQINNWNIANKNQQKEVKILKSLKDDFQSNLNELVQVSSTLPVELSRLYFNLDHFGTSNNEFSRAEIDSMINTGFIITDLVDGALNSVLNSDQLELISNDSLRFMLTRFPSSVRKFKQHETHHLGTIIDMQRPMLEQYVSLLDLPRDMLAWMGMSDIEQLKINVPKSNFVGLLNDLSYQNIIIARIYNSQVHYDNTEVLIGEVHSILNLIEKGLR